MPIDPILSVLVAFLVLRGAWQIASRSWHVLMEGAPDDLDVEKIEQELCRSVPGLLDIHHVHLWALTPERPLMTLHARIADDADHDAVRERVQTVLTERFGLNHATIQTERGACAENDRDARDTRPDGKLAGHIHGMA